MSTYRDIITEACNRSNVVPRKRDIPADIFTTASKLLKGILQDYSNRKYITAYRDEVDFTPVQESFLVGEGPDVIVEAPKLQVPEQVLYKLNENQWIPLNFVSYEQFYQAPNTTYTVSWQPTGANQYKIYLKPVFLTSARICKLIYTKEMEYNDNDTVNLPTPYVELLTRALAYALAVQYPRIDQTIRVELKSELASLEQMLIAANSSNRIITRDSAGEGSLLSNFLGGSFIY